MSIVVGYACPDFSMVATDTRRRLDAGGFDETEKIHPIPNGWMAGGGRSSLHEAVTEALWRSAPGTPDGIADTTREACAPLLRAEREDGGAKLMAVRPHQVLQWLATGKRWPPSYGLHFWFPPLTTGADPDRIEAEIAADYARADPGRLLEVIRFLARVWLRVIEHTDAISATVEVRGFLESNGSPVPVALSATVADILEGDFRVRCCGPPEQPKRVTIHEGVF